MRSQPWTGLVAPGRLARTRAGARETSRALETWFDERSGDDAYRRFAGHFATLRQVLTGMVDAVAGSLPADGVAGGELLDACRAAEARLALVARLHAWYATKYEQRDDPRLAPALLAADEVVRSCWATAFGALGRPAPSGPLVHLEERHDALATPRAAVPSAVRTADDVLAEFVRELPVPVVALPLLAGREPWWLVLAAHETGHHVQRDVPGLTAATRTAVAGAVAAHDPDGTLANDWLRWSDEAFADAFAALSVGPAAAWAVAELQVAGDDRMIAPPRSTDRYPPPAVRIALLGELARQAGAEDPGPGADAVRDWLDAVPERDAGAAAARHLAVLPAVAGALCDLQVEAVTLREVCGWTAGRFAGPAGAAPGGETAGWARVLAAPGRPLTGVKARQAARLAVAGGVAAFRDAAAATDWSREPGRDGLADWESAGRVAALRDRMLDVLPRCGPPGVLAAAPHPDPAALAERLSSRLLAVDVGLLGDPDGAVAP